MHLYPSYHRLKSILIALKDLKIANILPQEEFYSSKKAGAIAIWSNEVYSQIKNCQALIFCRYTKERLKGVKYCGLPVELFFSISKFFSFSNTAYTHLRYNLYPAVIGIICRMKSISIIHVHNRTNYPIIIKRVFPKAKIILHLHNDHFLNLKEKQVLQVYKACHKIISVSQYIKRGVDKELERQNLPLSKSVALLNGVNTKKIKAGLDFGKKINVLFVGRLVEEKGVLELIKAFNLLPETTKNKAELTIVGGGTFGSELETAYIKKLKKVAGGNSCIKFTGPLSHHEVIQYIKFCHIYVIPSIWNDPCPLTVLEGMAGGKALIGSNKGGIPELIGEAGLLIDPEDLEDFSAKLNSLLVNESLIIKFGELARIRVESLFSWKIVANNFEELFLKIK